MLTIMFYNNNSDKPVRIASLNQETLPNPISPCLFAVDARGRNSKSLTSPINRDGAGGRFPHAKDRGAVDPRHRQLEVGYAIRRCFRDGLVHGRPGCDSFHLNANGDVDVILAGNYGPATGNAITGTGTISGSRARTWSLPGPASPPSRERAGPTPVSRAASCRSPVRWRPDDRCAGQLQLCAQSGLAERRVGRLHLYAGRPRRQHRHGDLDDQYRQDAAGRPGQAVQVVPGPDGVVTLPPGVELSDIHVVGRNLVVDMPDGTQMIIVDGAVFVPQLVLGTVQVPSTNLAALLIDSEPRRPPARRKAAAAISRSRSRRSIRACRSATCSRRPCFRYTPPDVGRVVRRSKRMSLSSSPTLRRR